MTRLIGSTIFGLLLAAPLAIADDSAPASAAPAAQRAVLVTGASTGIGRRITERLAAEGWFVYAGARKDKDLQELDAIENVQALRLDVTRSEEIAAAAVLHSLSDASPRPRYMVVPVPAEAEATIRKAIEELVQLNAAQPFSYDRRQLVEMLDAALGSASR